MNISIPMKPVIYHASLKKEEVLGVMLICALLAFEIFNFSTTEFALTDLLGNLQFLSIRWATILAIAFCGIDFAGLALLLTPEGSSNMTSETWYLFGAWILAATMNAILTWWGISIAIINNKTIGTTIIEHGTMLSVIPIFIAIIVWLTRIMIIGTFSTKGQKTYHKTGYLPEEDKNRFHSSRQLNQAESNFLRAPKKSSQKLTPQITRSEEQIQKTVQRQEPVYTSIDA